MRKSFLLRILLVLFASGLTLPAQELGTEPAVHYVDYAEDEPDKKPVVIYRRVSPDRDHEQELGNVVPPQVHSVVNPEMAEYVTDILKDNLWILVVFGVLVVLVLYIVLAMVSLLLKGLAKRFDNSEYIEFGKLKIKNKHYKPKGGNGSGGSPSVNIEKFVSVIELVLSTEISNAIAKTIEIINGIHQLEATYIQQCRSIFKSSFSGIRNAFHDKLFSYISGIEGINPTNVYSSKEYFFLSDFLTTAELNWIDQTKDIIARNGFVEMLSDRKKAQPYIEELESTIWQAVDFRKMQITGIKKQEFDDIVADLFENSHDKLENMFYRLGKMKETLEEKKSEKLDILDNKLEETVTSSLTNIVDRFLGPNKDSAAETEPNPKESK